MTMGSEEARSCRSLAAPWFTFPPRRFGVFRGWAPRPAANRTKHAAEIPTAQPSTFPDIPAIGSERCVNFFAPEPRNGVLTATSRCREEAALSLAPESRDFWIAESRFALGRPMA